MMEILKMTEGDIAETSLVHKAVFSRQQLSSEWIRCNFDCYPRVQYYLAKNSSLEIVGYIQWTQKSGFRKGVVLELEQMAVIPKYQGQGIGCQLIYESLPLVQTQLDSRGASIKHVLVTTRSDNQAQRLYKKVLNAEVESVISNLYSNV